MSGLHKKHVLDEGYGHFPHSHAKYLLSPSMNIFSKASKLCYLESIEIMQEDVQSWMTKMEQEHAFLKFEHELLM